MVTIQVPPEILDQTDKCWMAFFCLENGKCGCEVRYRAAKNILFLRDTPPPGCPYSLRFGTAYVCRCPTHRYLCDLGQLRRAQ